jgi:hypothetical protein
VWGGERGMGENYYRVVLPVVVLLVFMAAMLGLFTLGRKLRAHRKAGEIAEGIAVIDGAIFALMGLLIGFEYAGAATRFDDRRKLIVEEVNAIGTAYLRIDVTPSGAQPKLRDDFRKYLEARIAVYEHIDDVPTAMRDLADATELQKIIWKDAVDAASQAPTTAPSIVFLPAVNAMIDITTMRTAVFTFHTPTPVIAMLVAIAFVCAMLAGFEMGGGSEVSRLHVMGFVAILALTIYIVLDMEFPRRGLIRVDETDKFLLELRNLMK